MVPSFPRRLSIAHGGAGTYRRRAFDAWLALAGLLVLVLSGLAASSGRVGGFERAVFHLINGLPEWLYGPMAALQFLGTLAIGPVVVVVALLLRRWRLAGAAAAATLLKLGLERVVKRVVERQRPGTSIPDAIVRGDVPVHGFSFVSGHLVLVGALATLVSPYLRGRWKVVPWAFVALVGIARIYLGAHTPLDVTGGTGLGLFIGGALNLIFGVPAAPGSKG